MSCEKAESLFHGCVDGELDAARAVEFERHGQHCPVCTRQLDAQQSLRARLRDADLYAPAPPSLRRSIRDRLELPTGEGATSGPRWVRRRRLPGRTRARAMAESNGAIPGCSTGSCPTWRRPNWSSSPACCGADAAIAPSVPRSRPRRTRGPPGAQPRGAAS
jgi:anti-sigma factor RsiW